MVCEKMSSFCEKMSEKILGLYVFIMLSLGYTLRPNKEVDSLIVTKNEIEIIEMSIDTDKDNLINYLKHHIMYTDDKFHPMYFFDNHLFVRFKYQNEIFQICLTQLESKNTDHSVIMKEPKFLSAVIKKDTNKNEPDPSQNCITEILVELHGPERNFFKHIPDTVCDLSVLLSLKKHTGLLYTFDMLGNDTIHELKLGN